MPVITRRGPKPRDSIIEAEVSRRLKTGEPITFRSIREAVGGSPKTIKGVFIRLGVQTDAPGSFDRELQVRERLRHAGEQLSEAEAYFKGARESGESMAREITSTLATVRDAHTMLVRETDGLRTLMGEMRELMIHVRRELAINRPPTAGDPLLEAKLKKAAAENGRMAQTIEQMKRQLHDAGVTEF
jgi:hypothetical protein